MPITVKSIQKRKSGARSNAITLPDGNVMTREDILRQEFTRWTPSRKAAIVLAVQKGLFTLTEVKENWSISLDEFISWQKLFKEKGFAGLRSTYTNFYRN